MGTNVSILDKLDNLIKVGQGYQVRDHLSKLKPSDVSRAEMAGLAKIALRVGDADFAYALLRPLVHSETPIHPPVTANELLQYGMCLKQMGASGPALKIFSKIRAEEEPDVLLYESITLF